MKPFRTIRSSDGMILVSALLIMLAMTTLGIMVTNTTTSDIRLSANYHDSKQAYYAAEAGLVLVMEEIRTRDLVQDLIAVPCTDDVENFVDFAWHEENPKCRVGLGNEMGFSVTLGSYENEPPPDERTTWERLFVESNGIAPLGSQWQMKALVRKVCEKGADGYLRAAVTANGPINSKGTLIIDGRDHGLIDGLALEYGDPTENTGTLGVSTAGTYVREGSSQVGGTDWTVSPPVDIAPRTENFLNVVETNTNWGDLDHEDYDMPLTPDEILGYPPPSPRGPTIPTPRASSSRLREAGGKNFREVTTSTINMSPTPLI